MESIECRLCGGKADHKFDKEILGDTTAKYYSCRECRYFQTEEPHWLERAYQNPINDEDEGLLARNLFFSDFILCAFWFQRKAPFLDFAGGYGVLVRLMRDFGFEFFWHDPFCRNVFAKGFERDADKKVSVVTAFEVLEHAHFPNRIFSDLLNTGAEDILISTVLFKGDYPQPDWWYLGPSHGQHIGFFNRSSIRHLAAIHGMHVASFRGLHWFSGKPVSRVRLLLCGLLASFHIPRVVFQIRRHLIRTLGWNES